VLAHFGDTRGRKRVFTASVLLMALPTLTIGLLPTFASVGIAAPLLLLLMRIVQGAALGGEIPGAWVFVAEHAANRKSGLAIGLLTSGLCTGFLLGSLTAIGLDLTFGSELILRGAWRIPFSAESSDSLRFCCDGGLRKQLSFRKCQRRDCYPKSCRCGWLFGIILRPFWPRFSQHAY